jgi:8-amino-7-oxononanoate synthase
MNLSDRWQIELERLRAGGRYRTLTPPVGIDFSSNDYLGFARHAPSVAEGSRSGAASRLLRGHHPIWDEVESKLAAWHGAEAALVMTSGYVANEGLLSAIVEAGDVVFSDQCNHASIIDGLRLSRAEKIIFRHNDVNELETRMRQQHASRRPGAAWFIVTESLFGMEGDTAPLPELAEVAQRYQAYLIVDEAHATGCFGPAGSGLIDAAGLRGQVLASVHTGGKALAVPGAYIACSRQLKELLVNSCRHFIYTTALPPQIGQWWLDALERVAGVESARTALHARAKSFRKQLAGRDIELGGTNYIATVRIGADDDAVNAARRLQQAGFDVRAIRPPTVPPGTARLRISIHADHEEAVLQELASTIQQDLR